MGYEDITWAKVDTKSTQAIVLSVVFEALQRKRFESALKFPKLIFTCNYH
jgi:hypothetical protein